MLFRVRNYFLLLTLALAAALGSIAARQSSQQPNQAAPEPSIPLQPTQASAPAGPVIVLNPAHGGTDTGARGGNGLTEKDVVLGFAREVRAELVRQGFRVTMTRDDDSNPSYDDRAAIANGYRDAIFISIHVSSTGDQGTARAYYYRFANPLPSSLSPAKGNIAEVAPVGPEAASPTPIHAPAALSFTPWSEAQKQFVDASRRFADVLQGELRQRFAGSPTASAGFAIRGMQSVAAPAVAVEISSVSVSDPGSLLALGAPLAASVSHAIQTYRPPGSAETK